MINLINARIAFKVEISLSVKIFKNVYNLPLGTIETWVSPKISWKLEIVLTGDNDKLFCIPKLVIFGKMTAFGPVETLTAFGLVETLWS